MDVKLITPAEQVIAVSELPAFVATDYTLRPFDELTLNFLDTYSRKILSDSAINRLPEITALGFWLRRGNLNQIRSQNQHLFENKLFISTPIGKVFHICPANVDTMFFYSFVVSVLMGNRNILRVSTRMEAPQIMTLFTMLNKLLNEEKYALLKSYINIINYGHDDNISEYISQRVNARMIWGGDATISRFKAIKTAPRTKDVVFADRVSVMCVLCSAYLALDTKGADNFAALFFNDAYTFDQMGCSSPQTIYFIGTDEEYSECARVMLSRLENHIENKYQTEVESLASLKLNQAVNDVVHGRIDRRYGDNFCTFVQLKDAGNAELLHSCGAGYFYIRHIGSPGQLAGVVGARLQTVSYFGLSDSDLLQLQKLANHEGIDRIVPLGTAMNFHYIWDGYNLLDELSRKVFIK